MSHWEYSGQENSAPSIAGYEIGETLDFQLTFVNDEVAMDEAYVFVSEEYFDILQVKLPDETEDDWRPVYGMLDGTGYLGTLSVGETAVDFRIQVLDDTDIEMLRIPIYVGYADGATSSISFLWQYRDLLDYAYPGDETGTWIYPDGPGDDYPDWRLWADCDANQLLWRDDYASGRRLCDSDVTTEESFSETADPAFWLESGEPWL